jgi:hypothetical protein
VSCFDAFVAEIWSTLRLAKFFMESPNWLEHIWEPLKMLSLCCNTEAQSRMTCGPPPKQLANGFRCCVAGISSFCGRAVSGHKNLGRGPGRQWHVPVSFGPHGAGMRHRRKFTSQSVGLSAIFYIEPLPALHC